MRDPDHVPFWAFILAMVLIEIVMGLGFLLGVFPLGPPD